MNGRVGLLAALLLAQLVIVAILLWSQNRSEGNAEKLVEFEPKAVDRVVIAEATESIELVRKDGVWTVGDSPADQAKADKLVTDFAGFASPWPVATTASSAERFEVAEDKFQKRLTFHGGDKVLGDVLLGTSPGFQRVHARRAGSDSVYAINFSNFQAPTKADDWIDKALLAAESAVTSVVAPSGFRLQKGDEGWLLDGAAANQDAAAAFAERFENLRIIGVAPGAGATDKGTFTLVDGKGEFTLQVSQGEDENEYVLRSSRRPGYYRLASYIAEQMLEGREELVAEAAPADTAPADAADAAAPVDATAQ